MDLIGFPDGAGRTGPMTDVRGCPGCRHSVRAGDIKCPHCGALLNLPLKLNWLDGTEETIKVPMPDPKPDPEE